MKINKFNLLSKFALLYCLTLFLVSCTEENNSVQEEAAFKNIATQFLENAKGTSINHKKINANYESFMNSLNDVQNESNGDETTFTFTELSEMLEINFDIPKENTMEFFNIAYENRDVLLSENARELLIARTFIEFQKAC